MNALTKNVNKTTDDLWPSQINIIFCEQYNIAVVMKTKHTLKHTWQFNKVHVHVACISLVAHRHYYYWGQSPRLQPRWSVHPRQLKWFPRWCTPWKRGTGIWRLSSHQYYQWHWTARKRAERERGSYAVYKLLHILVTVEVALGIPNCGHPEIRTSCLIKILCFVPTQ